VKELGRQLRRLLTPRALAAWCGTDRLSAVAAPAVRAAERELTPAAAPFALFVAGSEVPVALLAALDLEKIEEVGLVEVANGTARARLALLPLERALLACDRLDQPITPELVCWPDDSSYHLAKALPPVGGDWLDVACGSAFAPLFVHHPACIADLNELALARAGLGGLLSDVPLEPYRSDVLADVPARTWDLISCNAPIPDDPGAPLWRSTTMGFFERLYNSPQAAAARLVVIHAAESALAPLADLPGERVVVAYTPEPGFAVAWWAPGGESRYVSTRRPLTDDRPHVTYEDRAAALC